MIKSKKFVVGLLIVSVALNIFLLVLNNRINMYKDGFSSKCMIGQYFYDGNHTLTILDKKHFFYSNIDKVVIEGEYESTEITNYYNLVTENNTILDNCKILLRREGVYLIFPDGRIFSFEKGNNDPARFYW